jgi:hypothetical protein
MSKARGSGQTTRQMLSAREGAVFVWVNHDTLYAKKLAARIGRTDLEIVGPQWLENGWIGRSLSGLVIDHAARQFMTATQRENIARAYDRVRPLETNNE